MPVTHTIIIKRKDDDPTKDLILEDTASDGSGIGELESDDAVRLNSGDKVQWISDLGNFCVLFKDEPPFNGNFVTVGNRKGESTLLKVAKKLGGGSSGHPTVLRFSYAVTVVEPSLEDGTLTATTIDPLLDISDSSGGTL